MTTCSAQTMTQKLEEDQKADEELKEKFVDG